MYNAGEDSAPKHAEFTREDEINLCRYIADRIPDKTTGGRRGNEIYKQLVAFVSTIHVLVSSSIHHHIMP